LDTLIQACAAASHLRGLFVVVLCQFYLTTTDDPTHAVRHGLKFACA